MIYTYEHLTRDQNLNCDVCIVGSGAGGSAAASSLSEAGLKVIVLEAGSYLIPKDFNQREETMYPKLFYEAGGRRTANRALRVLHGHGVGGSTLHNINLCKQIPKEILSSWKLKHFKENTFRHHLNKVEKDLGVTRISPDQMNESNRLFKKGVLNLHYQGGTLKHNRKGCIESGFCELGCSFNAKMNALRVYIPKAVKNGAKIFANTRAFALVRSNKKIKALEANVIHPETKKIQAKLSIKARWFVLSGGAIETPLLMLRSDLPDPNNLIGKRLHLHPGVVALGVFPEKVEAWKGIPQSYECTEFLSFNPKEHDKRVWLIASSAHPIGAASMVPGMGSDHHQLMKLYPRIVPITPMIHDLTTGSVQEQWGGGAKINYVLNTSDRQQLAKGLKESAKILFAGGAQEVVIPSRKILRLKNPKDIYKTDFKVEDFEMDLVAVHPMSSVWMGNSPKNSCLDSTGRYHHLDNLYVADTSVYPTSLGIPPQVTTYGIGHFVANSVLGSLPHRV